VPPPADIQAPAPRQRDVPAGGNRSDDLVGIHIWTHAMVFRVSQIPEQERLRSNSSSCPDNIWGLPSNALGEASSELRPNKPLECADRAHSKRYYTSKAGQVFRGLAGEWRRIDATRVKGLDQMVRRQHGGGYFTVLTPPQSIIAR
jgi:hypothetical protein